MLIVVAAFLLSFGINTSKLSIDNFIYQTAITIQKDQNPPRRVEFPLNCTYFTNQTKFCPTNYPASFESESVDQVDQSSNPVCPDYFRWIHEDLRPWKATGITRDMVERANSTAHFRLVVVKGKAYVEKYKKSIQSRDLFTIWGILQLLRRYPGKIPDLELMFDCDDRPVVKTRAYTGPNMTQDPPPLFRYCGDRWTMDIVFPDWSFWGWAEINIKPWESLLKEIKQGNENIKWMEREPFAYWKGNPHVADGRRDLLKCNVSETQDWNARLFIQDWILEYQQGYKHSNVANQCTHRYKIYIEGWAWSVSEKYILSCDSVTLLVKPRYYDFFTRSLQPLRHYWPIRDNDKCRSIKFAVDWGNNNKEKAQAIGKAASDLIQEEVKMDYVYDYMFHLLIEYSKLLKFEPTVPEGAVELCAETVACPAEGQEKKFMNESLVKSPAVTTPCTMPHPYEPQVLKSIHISNLKSIRKVEKWENEHWEKMSKKQQG
ncbi:O-glucosyltransferase rumi [Morus notabilis]|nr:O-glucosyltransferase rumi [Morus notabilis]